MSAFRVEDRIVRKTAGGVGIWNYVFLLLISLLFVCYFLLWGYLVIEGSKVLTTLPDSEATTLYGP
jgi:hypothetical protein